MTSSQKWIKNVTVATLEGEGYGLLHDAVVGIKGDEISFVGNAKEAPAPAANDELIDGKGQLLTPGLIDCHTHLVWAYFPRRRVCPSFAWCKLC